MQFDLESGFPLNKDLLLLNRPEDITRAADIIRDGGLLAFPTETVYGLGADATNDKAVAAIFEAKGRPQFNPLILHFPDAATARSAVVFNDTAQKLADVFWPGALSLVLPKKEDCPVSLLASAGLDTLAVRVPHHPLALALLKEVGCPVAAPSANRSGHISPTRADHVLDGLGDRVDAVLDGGACAVGLESTVLDLSADTPTLLRPGGISKEDIEAVIGTVAIADGSDDRPRSPGMLARHYAPSIPVRLNATRAAPGEALLAFGPGYEAAQANLSPSGDLKEAAANLFSMLRSLDRPDFSAIAVTAIPWEGLGDAINDRLKRATAA